jgi:hypothetical protein
MPVEALVVPYSIDCARAARPRTSAALRTASSWPSFASNSTSIVAFIFIVETQSLLPQGLTVKGVQALECQVGLDYFRGMIKTLPAVILASVLLQSAAKLLQRNLRLEARLEIASQQFLNLAQGAVVPGKFSNAARRATRTPPVVCLRRSGIPDRLGWLAVIRLQAGSFHVAAPAVRGRTSRQPQHQIQCPKSMA